MRFKEWQLICRHPGNLLRTPDGKICILDYGLMTEVGSNLDYDPHCTPGLFPASPLQLSMVDGIHCWLESVVYWMLLLASWLQQNPWLVQISPNKSIALVEYIAHLTTEDYESIPGQLASFNVVLSAPDCCSPRLSSAIPREGCITIDVSTSCHAMLCSLCCAVLCHALVLHGALCSLENVLSLNVDFRGFVQAGLHS